MVGQGWSAGWVALLTAIIMIFSQGQIMGGVLSVGSLSARLLQVETLKARAQFHLLNFDYDAALASINSALDTLPDNPALYVARGRIYLLLYEWDQVMADYNAALALDPAYADAYYYRGLLYYTTLVDRVNALPDFEQYLVLAPDGPHVARALDYTAAIRAELDVLAR